MNTKVKIYSPKPLRRSVFRIPDHNSGNNNSKFLSHNIICENPFNLHSCIQESPKILDNHPSDKLEVCAVSAKISNSKCSPMGFTEYEEDFFDFKKNLCENIEENEAISEILSILSTDNTDSNGFSKYIRSSMPPIRPVNPILKAFHIEDSTESPLSEMSEEFQISKNRKSINNVDLESK
jgi:hypothetical protein